MAELWLLISAPPICPRSNSSVSPAHSPLKMCDLDSIPLAEHYWPRALTRRSKGFSTACWGRRAPFPGRSNIRKREGLGTFWWFGRGEDCCARGRAHSEDASAKREFGVW
jgi:hypothetical protein